MSDDRTPEQRSADRQLDDAVRRAAAVYGHVGDGSGRLVTDWLVIGTGIGMSSDGDQTTVSFQVFPDGGNSINWHAVLGLLRASTLRLEHTFVAAEDEE